MVCNLPSIRALTHSDVGHQAAKLLDAVDLLQGRGSVASFHNGVAATLKGLNHRQSNERLVFCDENRRKFVHQIPIANGATHRQWSWLCVLHRPRMVEGSIRALWSAGVSIPNENLSARDLGVDEPNCDAFAMGSLADSPQL